MISEQGSRLVTVEAERVDVAPAIHATGSATLDEVPADQFDALIRLGQARGGLTQDDVMTVLRPVELSAELISDIVDRIRAAGVEFTYDTDETTVVPMSSATDGIADPLLGEVALVSGAADAADGNDHLRPARLLDMDPPTAPARRNGGAPVLDDDEVPVRPHARPERTARRGADRDGYGEGDAFRGSAADPVHMYLKEIGKVKLLDAALEVELAERILAGYAAAERLAAFEGGPGESYPDRVKDRVMVRRGQSAKEALIEANLRLVVSIAKRYRNRGLAFLDLIQEGNLGLMRAVEKFDHTKGFKFSTYATWWIRQAITRAIADQARTIRIPVHMVETINKVVWAQRQLLQELGREPSAEEVAGRVDFSIERVREIQRINQDTVSLEQPMGDEDDFSLSDLIEDREAVVPDDAAARIMLDDAVREALGHLSPREQDVVRLRFGLEDGKIRTLEEVGKAFGVTRERIRQIEAKTLAKLRRPESAQLLRDYLDEA